ncbi:hypothetical protein QJQ45_026785 [Haematococcus lacustris]|nr:hypothetical protein QJQ45_026785 [Haematococcus lacustris]
MVRDCFTRVTVLAYSQELLDEIPAEVADIPDFAERNLFLQLGRGVPPPGENSRPSAAVEAVLAAYPDLHAELDAIPRYPQDINTVDDVGQKLETSFVNNLIELFKRRVGQAVALAGARTVRGAEVRCNSAATGRPLALAYGAAGFSGSGSIGSRGVPVTQMLREACKQFPRRVVLVHEFRTSRVSSTRTNVVAGQA